MELIFLGYFLNLFIYKQQIANILFYEELFS